MANYLSHFLNGINEYQKLSTPYGFDTFDTVFPYEISKTSVFYPSKTILNMFSLPSRPSPPSPLYAQWILRAHLAGGEKAAGNR